MVKPGRDVARQDDRAQCYAFPGKNEAESSDTVITSTILRLYWWPGMKKDIEEFVAKCQNFQQVKYEHQRPIVVDRLTKSAHFIPVKTDYNAQQLARVNVTEVVSLHGVSLSIILDRDAWAVGKDYTSVRGHVEGMRD
ncbi:hypothetical protein MTR67_002080 [Solanum verrucosum]|uniref:Integrase zinc-binding domain-containing protein n=1 Tax=Solanum verrucosum TaxID=315347 RepID=A0AAF0TCZ7_SOLVR|nr:hypothetical protein MTR67_002080 [Solanum verrucosum]